MISEGLKGPPFESHVESKFQVLLPPPSVRQDAGSRSKTEDHRNDHSIDRLLDWSKSITTETGEPF